MTVATSAPSRRWPGTQRTAPTLVGAGLGVLGVVVLATQGPLRRGEAMLAAFLLGHSHVATGAQAVGTAILFPHDHRWIGIDLTPGCASALLIVPFIFLTGGILIAGRLRPARALTTLLAVSGIVALTNQARLAAISGAMRVWGLQTGYARGHILIGSLVSTFGVAVGVVVFLVAITRPTGDRPSRQRARGARR